MAVAEALERDEVVRFAPGEFPLPDASSLDLLRSLKLAAGWKNVRYDVTRADLAGARGADPARVRSVLSAFSAQASRFVGERLPGYAAAWQPDQATFRPEEESARRLPWRARNDRLHVDAFPGRPSGGRRILRFFVNVHPTEDRVWITGPSFAETLARYGARLERAPRPGVWSRLVGPRVATYDAYMLSLHDAMKRDDALPHADGPVLAFAPGEAWLVFTDAVSHAVRSGRWALEHSWFVPVDCLHSPDTAPVRRLPAG